MIYRYKKENTFVKKMCNNACNFTEIKGDFKSKTLLYIYWFFKIKMQLIPALIASAMQIHYVSDSKFNVNLVFFLPL